MQRIYAKNLCKESMQRIYAKNLCVFNLYIICIISLVFATKYTDGIRLSLAFSP